MINLENCVRGCSTGACLGLSQQIIEEMQRLKPGVLVKIQSDLILCQGMQNNPYLQREALSALVKAVKDRGTTLIINSCFRTIAQQWLLRQQYERGLCGIMAAAPPPRSNHNSGLAIDVQDARGWRSYLEKRDWKWIGAFDPMHFDFFAGENLSSLQVLAFQRLWNRNYPKSAIAEDGIYGKATESKLAISPANGFGNSPIIKRGDFNRKVGELQLALRKELKLSATELVADSKFGSTTQRYLVEFQRQNGLGLTGIADKETLAKLGLYVEQE